jgi:hypothetical protein
MRPLKKSLFPILALIAFLSGQVHAQESNIKMKLRITINENKVVTATLEDNATVAAFKEMLPLTLDMSDLHANEKKFDLPRRLPTKDSNPKTIQAGDLMIWNSRTVVLFYKSFPTSYSYTKIGRINDAFGLADAVGSEDVRMSFELE